MEEKDKHLRSEDKMYLRKKTKNRDMEDRNSESQENETERGKKNQRSDKKKLGKENLFT